MTMTTLTNAGSRALHWTQTRLFDSTYDLVENESLFARMTFRTLFGSLPLDIVCSVVMASFPCLLLARPPP